MRSTIELMISVVAFHHRLAGTFDGDVRARAHSDAEIDAGQGRSIFDPINNSSRFHTLNMQSTGHFKRSVRLTFQLPESSWSVHRPV